MCVRNTWPLDEYLRGSFVLCLCLSAVTSAKCTVRKLPWRWNRESGKRGVERSIIIIIVCTVQSRPIIGVIRPERVRRAGRIERTGGGEKSIHRNCLYCCKRKTSSGRKNLGDQSVDGVIILRGIAMEVFFLTTEKVKGVGGGNWY